MANPELGAKQICPSCSSKFYDLNRRPAHCPKCATEFDPEEALRSRRARPRGPLPEDDTEPVRVVPEVEADEEELETAEDEAPELDAGAAAEPLEVAEDDEDAGTDAAPAAPDEALGVDFAEEDELAEADDDEVPFIEDDEDEFSEDEIDGLPEGGGSED